VRRAFEYSVIPVLFPAVIIGEENFRELLLSILSDVRRCGPREPRHLKPVDCLGAFLTAPEKTSFGANDPESATMAHYDPYLHETIIIGRGLAGLKIP